ncbi:PaaI family thioesterase [Gleimia hominis]|uniref:PaaI family thioesterase n=1 Tax=Gleimia hominis TaxID=595468 RepID=UPI0018EC295A|nr:hotdog fold thioesterase [Gleimia hominis]WIK65333.1 hotdog fold thioesterase [Gleimia hominis]
MDATVMGALAHKMGIELVDLSAEGGYATMPVEGNTQPIGLLHGGASAVLAEQLGSLVARANAPKGKTAVGIELNVTHHSSARSGRVHARAQTLKAGRSLVATQIQIRDDADQLCASARLTCMLIDAPKN